MARPFCLIALSRMVLSPRSFFDKNCKARPLVSNTSLTTFKVSCSVGNLSLEAVGGAAIPPPDCLSFLSSLPSFSFASFSYSSFSFCFLASSNLGGRVSQAALYISRVLQIFRFFLVSLSTNSLAFVVCSRAALTTSTSFLNFSATKPKASPSL